MIINNSIIQDLNSVFNNNVIDCYDIINNININKNDLDELNFDDLNDNYKKYKLYSNNNFELVVIKWFKNHETPIHQHPDNGCLLKLLYGELTEHRYNFNIEKISETYIKKNDISYIDNNLYLHKIECIKNGYSLHLYSPPNFYD